MDSRFQGYFPGNIKQGYQGCYNEKNGFVQCEGCGREYLDCREFRNRLGLSLRYRKKGVGESQERLLHVIAYLMIQCNAISNTLNRQGISDEAIEEWLDEKYPSMKTAWASLFDGEIV